MATKQQPKQMIQRLEEQITCGICLEHMKDPKTLLQCQHSFCLECIKPVMQIRSRWIDCPSCRKRTELGSHQGVKDLPTSFLINSITEMMEEREPVVCETCDSANATSYCQQCCSHGCDNCMRKHNKLKMNKTHTVTKYTDSKGVGSSAAVRTTKCKKHKNTDLSLYCETCDELICITCICHTHKKHQYECLFNMDTYVKYRRRLILTLKQPLLKAKIEATKQSGSIDMRCKEIKENGQKVKEDIKIVIQEVMKQVEKKLMDDVDTAVQKKLEKLEPMKQEMDTLKQQVTDRATSITDGIETTTPIQTFALKSKIKEMVYCITDRLRAVATTPLERADIKLMTPDIEEMLKLVGSVRYSLLSELKVEISNNRPFNKYQMSTMTLLLTLTDGSPVPVPPKDIKCHMTLPDNNPNSIVTPEHNDTVVQCVVRQSLALPDHYNITFTPRAGGLHQLHVKVYNCVPTGSPLDVYVSAPVEGPGAGIRGSVRDTIKGMKVPAGIATAPDGRVVVSEWGSECFTVITGKEKTLMKFGSLGDDKGQFKNIAGVAVTPNGTVLVVDRGNQRVQEFTMEGEFISCTKNGELNDPIAVAVDSKTGNVYIAESYQIAIFNAKLKFSEKVEIKGSLIDIAVDSQGLLYLVKDYSAEIQVITKDKLHFVLTPIEKSGSEVVRPGGIAIDHRDNVYVSNYDNNTVSVYNNKGNFVYSFKVHPLNVDDDCLENNYVDMEIVTSCLLGVACDSKRGVLYVSDATRNCVTAYNI